MKNPLSEPSFPASPSLSGSPPRSLPPSYTAGVDGEINFSLRGTLFGVGASAVGTFYTIYLKRYLSNVVDNSWLLTFYTNFNSCLILPLLCLVVFAASFEIGVRGSARGLGASQRADVLVFLLDFRV